VIGTTKDLFGYKAENLIGKSITILIPGLSNGNISSPGVNLQKLKETKFYGGRSLKGISFPTMVHIQYQKTKESQDIQFPLLIKVVSLPSIAGLITVHHTGMIQSINPVPAKYLFGYSTERLVEKVNIDQLIPQFSEIVIGLRRNNLLQYSCTVNTHACRWVISDLCTTVSAKKLHNNGVNKSLKELERTPSISSSGQKLPMLYAVHRDGSNFEVQLQLRLLESKEEDMISIWVTYDRVHALRRSTKRKTPADKTKSTYPANVAQKEETQLHTNIMFNDQQESIPLVLSPHTQETKDSKRPPIKSYGISSFGSVNYERRIYSDKSPETNTSTGVSGSRIESTNNVQNKPGPMDAYVIMETLGEGAYGTAKLAYRKDDPAKVTRK
jgi:hypothetical protein